MPTDTAQQIALSLRKIEQTKARITEALDYGHKAAADHHRRTLDSDLRRHADLVGFGFMNA